MNAVPVATRVAPILAIEGVHKAFGGVAAVDDVSFSVKQGEVFGIVGPNGAGKTTLFTLIAGTERASSGTVSVFGRCIDGLTPHARSRLGMGRTFQNAQVFTDSTVAENLAIVYTAHERRVGTPRRQAAGELLERLALDHVAAARAASISVFEQQRLAIAMALAGQPKLLLLDEPTGGLVEREVDELVGVLREIQACGVTLVVIDHKMRFMMSLCHRILVLSSGRVIALGRPEAVAADAEVRRSYLGEGVVV